MAKWTILTSYSLCSQCIDFIDGFFLFCEHLSKAFCDQQLDLIGEKENCRSDRVVFVSSPLNLSDWFIEFIVDSNGGM